MTFYICLYPPLSIFIAKYAILHQIYLLFHLCLLNLQQRPAFLKIALKPLSLSGDKLRSLEFRRVKCAVNNFFCESFHRHHFLPLSFQGPAPENPYTYAYLITGVKKQNRPGSIAVESCYLVELGSSLTVHLKLVSLFPSSVQKKNLNFEEGKRAFLARSFKIAF